MIQVSFVEIVYAVFMAASAIEIYFFMMQRSAIEIGRAAGFIDENSRRMLPLWFLIVWPGTAGKWWAAISIAIEENWVTAIALLVTVLIFQLLIPIPHKQFYSIFQRKLSREIGEAIQEGSAVKIGIYCQLYAAVIEFSKSD